MKESQITILKRLEQLYPDSSKQSLRKWVKNSRVSVNGQIIRRCDESIFTSDEVILGKKAALDLPFKILHTDESIIVVQKPAFMLSVASLDPKERSVHYYLKKHFKMPQIVPLHRLDREVAGPLVFVKNPKLLDEFKRLFINHSIHREYRAIVSHSFEEKSGTLVSYLEETAGYKMKNSKFSINGKRAVTDYQVLNQNDTHAYLSIKLKTGRKNQIRIQLSANGHPIVGDEKYGADKEFKKGIALYAHSLHFIHPITQKELNFCAAAPPFFQEMMKKCRLIYPRHSQTIR